MSARYIAPLYYAALAVILLIIFTVFYPARYAIYAPSLDEPSFFVGSLKDGPYSWFSSGYSRYFDLYPEWFAPYTNFIRPATNAYAWVLHHVFGDRFVYYLYTYYALVLLASIYLFRCLRDMGARGPILLFAAVIWPLSPAVVSLGLWNVPFMFDVAAAVLVIIAFRAVLSEHYAVAFVALALSVTTKETVLFAPVAAAATVGLTRRPSRATWAISAVMLLPLALWIVPRQLYFGGVFGGTYGHTGLASVLHGLFVWPSGVGSFKTAKNVFRSGDVWDAASRVVNVLALVTNGLLWVTIGAVCAKYLSAVGRRFNSGGSYVVDGADKPMLATLIWLGGALSLMLLNVAQGRYAASFFLFLILMLTAVASREGKALVGRLALSSLVALTILYIPHAVLDLRAFSRQAAQETKLYGSLERVLSGLGGPPRKVLVVNAPHGFSSPRMIGRFLGSPHEIVFANQFTGCSSAAGFSGVPVDSAQGLRIAIPECAKVMFDGVTVREFASGTVDIVPRAGIGTYVFGGQQATASYSVPGYALDGSGYYFKEAHKFSDVIYYDWSQERYETMETPR